jgi:hypothetical protein
MRPILKGATDQSTVIRIIDDTTGAPETGVTSATSGLDLRYRREGAATVALTESDLSALTDAHADGGLLHILGGYYRLDLPDAAFASGANGVLVCGLADGMVVVGAYHPLVDYNPQDGVRLGLTALPNAAADAAGGLVISDAGGFDIDNRAMAAAAVTNANTVFNTDFSANYNTTNDGWVVKLGDYAHGGSSANTTFGTLTVGGTTSLAAVTTSGTVTCNALTVSNATTLSGAVSLGSTLGITGAITVTNASNNLRLGTFTVDTNAIAWNASWDAEVQSEVTDSLVAHNLDHLCLTATASADMTTEVADNTILSRVLANGDTSAFDPSTDGLQPIKDAMVTTAQVNAEVVDALATDTYAEPGQTTPGATVSLAFMTRCLYASWRNKVTFDGTTISFFSDDGSTVAMKQTASVSSGTLTKTEITTGP